MSRPDREDYMVHDITGLRFMDLARYNRALDQYIDWLEDTLKIKWD